MTIEIDKLKSFFPEIDKALIGDIEGQFDISLARLGSYIYVNQNDVFEALQEKQARDNSQPLTLEELREMDGQPVWVHELTKTPIDGDYYGIVCVGYHHEHWCYSDGAIISNPTNEISTVGATPIEEYGITYVAYRYPLKEA